MTACTGAADAVFGPRVNIACRVFDFTLYFEDAFLACLPAVLFLLISPLELWLLWNETRRVQRSVLLYCKLGVLGVLFVCQLAFVLIRQLQSLGLQNKISLPTDVLELVAIASAAILSYIHHCRSIQPSTLLG